MQKGGFLRFLAPLLKSGLSLLKSVIKPLSMLGLTVAASAIDAAIHKKVLGTGNHTTLIISNDDLNYLLKIMKSLENSGILLDGITEKIKNEVKEQKVGFLSMLLGTLGASLLENMLAGKGVIRAGYGSKGQGTIIFVLDLLILCLKVINLLIQFNLFSPNNFKKNDDISLNYFLNKL